MKNYFTYLLIVFFYISYANDSIATTDLDILHQELLQKEYLFKSFSKQQFTQQINKLKIQETVAIWQINSLLRKFKILDFEISKTMYNRFPFALKVFQNKFYITEITKENSYLLGHELVKINGLSMEKIKAKIKTIFYLPHTNLVNKKIVNYLNIKSLLNYLQIDKQNILELTLVKNGKQEIVKIPFTPNLENDLLAKLKPKNKLFNTRKNKFWFWKYGINFGRQVFFKYNVCSSKEHFNKMKDSLNYSAKNYAKRYSLPLQEVYDAPSLNPIITTVIDKFKNKRYKKLIIDLRNNNKGAFLSAKKLLLEVSKNKRINKKGHLYILIDNNINYATLKLIAAFKLNTKAILVGEMAFGNQSDSNLISTINLTKNLDLKLPLKIEKEIEIIPEILIEPTLNQFKNGTDGLLQYVLN